jgi:hypothetical protein
VLIETTAERVISTAPERDLLVRGICDADHF